MAPVLKDAGLTAEMFNCSLYRQERGMVAVGYAISALAGHLPMKRGAGGKKKKNPKPTKHQLICLYQALSQWDFSCTEAEKLLWRWEFSKGNPVETKFERGSVFPSKQQF